MSAQSNALKLVTATTKARTSTAPGQQARQFQHLSTLWNALSVADKTAWKAIAQYQPQGLETDLSPKARKNANAYSAFIGVNTNLQSAGMDYNTTAPAVPQPPAALPTLTLTGTFDTTTFALELFSSQIYDYSVIVFAARPVLAGNNVFHKSAFKRIGVLSDLAQGGVNITSLYQTKFQVPAPGYEVALKLVGVMSSGYRTPDYIVTCVVADLTRRE